MKLVQVDHRGRCGTTSFTLFWAPDSLTKEHFRADLAQAQTAYRAAQEAALTFAGPQPRIGARTDDWVTASPLNPDTLTLGEMRAAARKAQEEYAAWEERRGAAMRPFSSFLAELGYQPFGQPAPTFAESVYWGRDETTARLAVRAEATPDPGTDLPGSLRSRVIQVPVPESEPWSSEGAYTESVEEYVTADPTEASTPVTPRDYDD